MKNPVAVHEDYGAWHPIVREPSFDYYNLDYLDDIWDINEWFYDMYHDENLWFNYEEVLDDIVYFSPVAVVRGKNYDAMSNILGLNVRNVSYSVNETIKTKVDTMRSTRIEGDLGFRIVRNR